MAIDTLYWDYYAALAPAFAESNFAEYAEYADHDTGAAAQIQRLLCLGGNADLDGITLKLPPRQDARLLDLQRRVVAAGYQ